MTRRPLVKSPALNDLGGLDELEELTCHVSAEQLELATLLGALEELGLGTGEGGDALGVREGLVELGRGGAELLGVGNCGGVYQTGTLLLGGGCCGGRSRWRSWGVELRGGEAADRI